MSTTAEHQGVGDDAIDAALYGEATPEWIARVHADHVITSWSRQHASTPLVIAGGEGSWFWDSDGKRYLDFESQLVNLNLGHQHPRLVQGIIDQAAKMCYIGPSMANEARSRAAAALASLAPGDLNRTFFTLGGAEANENAIRLARHMTGRSKILARYRSYHGATAGALSATGDPRRWLTEPGVPGIVRFFDPYTYRCSAGHPDPCPVCTGRPHLEEILSYEDPGSVAAIIMETVTGTNGVIEPPEDYLRSIRELCDEHGILLILDEVMAGFGRTGTWFAFEQFGVVPDMVTIAKGLNSGYVPLGGLMVTEQIGRWLDEHPFPGGLTYSGHPLACASAVTSIQIMQDEGVLDNVNARGEQLKRGLHELAERHPAIGEVRGRGCLLGLEMVKDRGTRQPLVPFNAKGPAAAPMSEMTSTAMDRGLYLSSFSNVVRVAPPLTVTSDEVAHGLEVLDGVLDIADRHAATA